MDKRPKEPAVWWRALLVIGFLYLFLLGISSMGGAFKWLGKDYTDTLLGGGSGPLVSLFIGIFATTLVQSSSTITSMVVALVAAGQLPYHSAIYMVMGANVGTTVTNSLVSLGHMRQSAEYERAFAAATVHDFFNLIVLLILFPLEVTFGFLDKMAVGAAAAFSSVGGTKASSPIKAITKPVVKWLKEACHDVGASLNDWFSTDFFGDGGGLLLIIGIAMTFAGLIFLVKTLRGIMISKLENLFDRVIFRSALRGLIFGLFLTILVQSSSITTSVAVPLVGAGVLTIQQVMPYTMGANIGTTITALIASLAALGAIDSGDPDSYKKAYLGLELAFHHVLFNVCGVAVVWWFRHIPIRMAERFARIAVRNRLYPLIYIILTFYVVPFLIIILNR